MYNTDILISDDALREFAGSIRGFVRNEVRPREIGLEADAIELPPESLAELQRKARRSGLWCAGTRQRHGGSGLPLTAQVILATEASQHRLGAYNPGAGGFGFDPPDFVMRKASAPVYGWAREGVLEGRRWFFALTEPSGGSDPRGSVHLSATKVRGGYVLNGTKSFVSHFDRSSWGLVFARAGGGITCFAVRQDTGGLASSPLPVIRPDTPFEVHFHDVEIPDHCRIGPEGGGLELAKDWLIASRIAYAAGCVGIGVAATAIALRHVHSRRTFGSPLSTRQSVQWALVNSHMELSAAFLLAMRAASSPPGSVEQRTLSASAKLAGAEAGWAAVDRAVQMLGAVGVSRELPLERWLREMRVKRIGEGASEIQRLLIARWVLEQEEGVQS